MLFLLRVGENQHQKVKDSQGDETVEVIMIITEDILARKVTDNKGRMVTVSLKDGEQYLIGDQHPGVVLIAVWILRRDLDLQWFAIVHSLALVLAPKSMAAP